MNVFLYFPDIFDEDKKVLNSFKEILLLSKKKGFNIYYSEQNLIDFKRLNDGMNIYLTGEINVLRQFLHNSRARNINHNPKSTIYNRWNLKKFEVFPCDEILSNIAEGKYLDSNYKCILVNLEDAIETCRNNILIFRDCIHLDYPDFFVKIDFVTNFVEFCEWLKTKHIKVFSLRDETRFQKKSSIIVKGATVFFEDREKRYWHLDTLHDYIEYEVYDSHGIHIATADEEGNLDANGKVKGRSINL